MRGLPVSGSTHPRGVEPQAAILPHRCRGARAAPRPRCSSSAAPVSPVAWGRLPTHRGLLHVPAKRATVRRRHRRRSHRPTFRPQARERRCAGHARGARAAAGWPDPHDGAGRTPGRCRRGGRAPRPPRDEGRGGRTRPRRDRAGFTRRNQLAVDRQTPGTASRSGAGRPDPHQAGAYVAGHGTSRAGSRRTRTRRRAPRRADRPLPRSRHLGRRFRHATLRSCRDRTVRRPATRLPALRKRRRTQPACVRAVARARGRQRHLAASQPPQRAQAGTGRPCSGDVRELGGGAHHPDRRPHRRGRRRHPPRRARGGPDGCAPRLRVDDCGGHPAERVRGRRGREHWAGRAPALPGATRPR